MQEKFSLETLHVKRSGLVSFWKTPFYVTRKLLKTYAFNKVSKKLRKAILEYDEKKLNLDILYCSKYLKFLVAFHREAS